MNSNTCILMLLVAMLALTQTVVAKPVTEKVLEDSTENPIVESSTEVVEKTHSNEEVSLLNDSHRPLMRRKRKIFDIEENKDWDLVEKRRKYLKHKREEKRKQQEMEKRSAKEVKRTVRRHKPTICS